MRINKINNERGNKSRRERYSNKLQFAQYYPVSICTINFRQEVNLAYIIRAAVCFGATEVCVIGSYPSRKLMNKLSGTLFDYIKIRAFPNPNAFLKYIEQENIKLVSIELPPEGFESNLISEYKFNPKQQTCLVIGHETIGVPVEILSKSDILYINMPGSGSCLNAATAGAIALYEIIRQFEEKK